MSSHTGVSCDSCMKANFPGRRYKCLLCDNYDLCGSCYDVDAESQNHRSTHPMQCILTETASELFYAGETIPRRTVVSLTCPHCALSGFIPRTLLTHCVEKHSSTTTSQGKNSQVVMCPICVTSPTHGSRSRFVLLADHIATLHDDGSAAGGDEDLFVSSSTSQVRRIDNEEEDSDEDEEEDDEPSINDLEHRAFVEEEHRRQEAARQRLAHASSLAAVIRNDYPAAFSGNSNSQRRPLSRQTAIRGSRGGLRGHFNSYPYGALPRTTTGYVSNASIRAPADPLSGNSSSNTTPNDPNGAFTFAQDPMFDFVSRLMSNNPPSSTTPPINPNSTQFLFPSSIPGNGSSSASTTAAEYARLQQLIDNNESMVQIKSTLLNAKQKRSSHAQQQQQQSSSAQPIILTHPSGYDYQLWQQQFPALQPSANGLSFLTGVPATELTAANSNIMTSVSKNSQQSYREYDPRSLLGKIIRNEHGANAEEANEIHSNQAQDYVSFLQSILLSTMITTPKDDQKEKELSVNKENHL